MQRQKRLQKAQSDILWFGRHYFPQYFTMETPDFHREMLDKAVGALHKRKGLVIAAPRNHSKCVAGDTVVYTDTGRKLIQDIVVGDNVQTLDENMKLSFGRVSHTWASGVKDLYRVTTISGHTIETTLDHKFYTMDGYKPLRELAVGAKVGIGLVEFSWNEIVSIEWVRKAETYDIEVEGTHNFVGNNFIVHNSTLFTFLIPLWAVCTKQKHFIVIFSSSAMQAESFLIDIKGELEQNSLLLDDYGPLGGDKYGLTWRNGDIVVGHPTRDENGDYVKDAKGLLVPSFSTRIVARGSEASTRGLRYGAYRPGLLIADDVDSEDSVLTSEQRMKVKSWWHKAVEPMLDPVEGVSIMVGTILHFDSLLSYMLSRDDVYDTFKYQAIQEDGTSLWPARWPIERLEEERKRLGTAAFGQEYLNNPLDDDARKFRPEWLTFYHLRELEYVGGVWRWNGKKLRIYQAYDLAIRQREQADKFAYAVIGVTAEHDVLILQSVGMHIDFPGQVRTVIEQWEIWRPERVGIETIGYQEALQQQIMNQALIPIVPIKKRGDKTLRITRMTPFFEQGKVLLRAADDDEPGSIDPEIGVKVHAGMKDLLTELMQYPRTAHDDLLDALEMALSLGQLSPGVQKISFDATGRDDYGGKMVNVAMKQNRPDEIPIPTQKTIWEYACPSCHKPVTIKRLNDEYLCMSCGLWSLPEKRLIHL